MASRADFEVVSLRIAGVWGSLHRHLRSNLVVPPEYETERGVADYVDWLRSGHQH